MNWLGAKRVRRAVALSYHMGTDNLKMILFSLLLDNYVAYCQTELQGQLTFDNSLFRDALNAMDQIDFDELKNSVTTDETSYAQSDSLFLLTMAGLLAARLR